MPSRRYLVPFLTLLVALLAGPTQSRPVRPPGRDKTPAVAPSPESVELDRLWSQARLRHALPGGAVELIRMDDLRGWLPRTDTESRLQTAARDAQALPTYRATAQWLLREHAERRLNAPGADAAATALGLLDGFAMRPGPAPAQSTDALNPEGFRAYPHGAGHGVLWLEAFVRPAQESAATLATRLVATGGPAVLRLGFDDAVTVWLNGDELYRSEKEHPAYLDQAAIPVRLRAGDNRLVVEVRQHSGAWRLIARVTDPAGEPIAGVTAHPDPWGPMPDPAEGAPPPTDAVFDLYARLAAVQDATPPDAVGLRDLADYAQTAFLPDADRLLPRVSVESAWEADPSPRSLRAWLDLLPEAEQGPVRAAHDVPRPLNVADVYADRALRLDEAWAHFHARRFLPARESLEALERESPDWGPALRLRTSFLEELELPNQAVARLEAAGAKTGPAAARTAWREALRAAGRTDALAVALQAEVDRGEASADEYYLLAAARRARGDEAGALALFDRLAQVRPEIWGYQLEALDIDLFAGRREAARKRLDTLLALSPDEPVLLERLARMQVADGEAGPALATLDRALAVDPANGDLRRYRDALAHTAPPAPLGPPLAELLTTPSPTGPAAHILYQHARAEVAPTGLGVREMRRVVRVLTAEGARQMSTWELPYTPGSQRLDVRVAQLIHPGEPPRSPQRTDRDLSEPQWRLYYDLRAEVLTFPRVVPGDVLEVAWQVADLDPDPSFPGYYGEQIWLQEAYPRAVSVVEAVTSLPLQVEVVAPPGSTLKIERSADGRRLVARDVPAVPDEPAAPGYASLRAFVHLSTLSGWAEATRRYQRLLAGRDQPDERLAAQAKAWVGESKTPLTAEEKVRRIYPHVATDVRYVGLELGTHSFRPESPHVTLARAYGDCKDKATLLIALLRAVDVDAQLTLVRTRSAGNVAPTTASFALFDHALVYLPGLDRFVDPTQDRNDPFALPPPDQGATGFVVGIDAGLRTLPLSAPEADLEAWSLDVTLRPDGTLAGSATLTLRGSAATSRRPALEAEGARREVFEKALAQRFPGAHAETPKIDGLRPAYDPLVVTTDVLLPAPPRDAGALKLTRAGHPWGLAMGLAHAAARQLTLVTGPARQAKMTMVVHLTPGLSAELPADVHRKGEFGAFDATAARAADTLTLETAWTLSVVEVPPERYADLRAWLSLLDHSLEETARLGGKGAHR